MHCLLAAAQLCAPSSCAGPACAYRHVSTTAHAKIAAQAMLRRRWPSPPLLLQHWQAYWQQPLAAGDAFELWPHAEGLQRGSAGGEQVVRLTAAAAARPLLQG